MVGLGLAGLFQPKGFHDSVFSDTLLIFWALLRTPEPVSPLPPALLDSHLLQFYPVPSTVGSGPLCHGAQSPSGCQTPQGTLSMWPAGWHCPADTWPPVPPSSICSLHTEPQTPSPTPAPSPSLQISLPAHPLQLQQPQNVLKSRFEHI